MADPKGFLKLRQRADFEVRDVSRVDDFNDVNVEKNAREFINMITPQASRCMDCGVPFCHFSCPLGNVIPEFNEYVYRGKWRDAFDRLSNTNNFPEFTGRVCPAPCEAGCVLGSIDPAVTIENIERVISDVAFNREYVKPNPPEVVTEKRIAIVGSGPAGLAAAQQLTRVGHTVVVYEKSDKPGGLLRYGIPNFKLEKVLIDRRLKQLKAEGVRFRCGVEVGVDLSFKELQQKFDAVILATGTGIANDVRVEGRELQGIYFAMDFLPQATRSAVDGAPLEIDANGKRVLIVGGGDTGSDCLGTSIRQGAEFVTTLQVLPKSPQVRNASEFYGAQPWPTYPQVYKESSSVKEGFMTGKSEILYETTVTSLIGDDAGNVKQAVLSQVEFKDGKFTPITGTERVIDVDLVLISVGFRGPETVRLAQEFDVELTSRNTIKRDAEFRSNVDKFFVAGDAGRGQSLVVWAIAEGRSVAAAVDKFLMGETELPAPIKPDETALKA
ncbi:MAG: glutamate synthase subunit beta [Candidatus Ancillula sp.]|jgi:glutamate synthase (NADPH/NADH) small chain|nr:glutamate synthase subunit beta [Candidatus Ancillula sp.]